MNKYLLMLALLIPLICSCWYYSFTDRPYPEIEKVYVESFENETDQYDLGPNVTEGIINRMHGGGLFDVVGKNSAQAKITGTIKKYTIEAYSYTSGEEPLEYIVKIRTTVQFFSVKDNKNLWEENIEGFATYPVDESTKDETQARSEAVSLLIDRIEDRLRGG